MSSVANNFILDPLALPIGSIRKTVMTGNTVSGNSTTDVAYEGGVWLPINFVYSQNTYPELYSQLGLLIGSALASATVTNGTTTILGTGVSTTYGNGLYVVGSDTTWLTSTNASTWTGRFGSGTTTSILALTYGNGLYVYAGNGGALRTSTDAITWDLRTSGTTSTINALTYGNGLYVYAGFNGVLGTSTDAITWTSRISGTTLPIYALTYGSGRYVYCAGGGVLATSTSATNLEYSPYYNIATQFYVPPFTATVRTFTLTTYTIYSSPMYNNYVRAK